MAEVKIKSAFVEDNKGFVLKVAEPHSRKNEQGGWDTVSRTFYDVKVSRDSGIDLSVFAKGSRLAVSGSMRTEVREHQGKKFYTLTVWADSVDALSQPGGGQVEQNGAGGWDGGGDGFSDSTPF